MAQGKLALKARIRSVDSTKKITKAMQLVASSKLKKQKEYMENNKEYAFYLKETVTNILSAIDEKHPYLLQHQARELIVVYTSDMGLCGGYNANVLRMLEKEVNKDAYIIIIGSRGIRWMNNHNYKVLESREGLDETNCYGEFAVLANKILSMYEKKEISSIKVLYTAFENSVSFIPKIETLLPITKQETGIQKVIMEFEPEGVQILNELIPMYIKSLLYSYYLEAKTSEQANRRMAMESATDNADEIKETLELQYNQARQAAITQEITEIVGGVSAIS